MYTNNDKIYNSNDLYMPSFEKELNSYNFYNEIMQEPNIDILKMEIEERGGSMGFFNISLVWNNTDDLDLSVITPYNEKIYFGSRVSLCGGKLDIDANSSFTCTKVPIENIYWNNIPINGKYKINVKNFCSRNEMLPTSFRCFIRYNNYIKAIDGIVKHKQIVNVFDDNIIFN